MFEEHRLLIISGICFDACLASVLFTMIQEDDNYDYHLEESYERPFDKIRFQFFNKRLKTEDLAVLKKVLQQKDYQTILVTGLRHEREENLPNSLQPLTQPFLSNQRQTEFYLILREAETEVYYLTLNEAANRLARAYGLNVFSLVKNCRSWSEAVYAEAYSDNNDMCQLRLIWEFIRVWSDLDEDYLYEDDEEYNWSDNDLEFFEQLEKVRSAIDQNPSPELFKKYFKKYYKEFRVLMNLPKHNPAYISGF